MVLFRFPWVTKVTVMNLSSTCGSLDNNGRKKRGKNGINGAGVFNMRHKSCDSHVTVM